MWQNETGEVRSALCGMAGRASSGICSFWDGTKMPQSLGEAHSTNFVGNYFIELSLLWIVLSYFVIL